MAKDKIKEILEELKTLQRSQAERTNLHRIIRCFASEKDETQALEGLFSVQQNKMNFLKCYYDLSESSQNNVKDIIKNSITSTCKDELLEVLNDETTKHMHYVVKFCNFFIENRIPKAKEEMLSLYNNEEKRNSFRKGIKGIFHSIHNKVNDYGYEQIMESFAKRISNYVSLLEGLENEPNKEVYLKVLNKIEYGINLTRSYSNFASMMPPMFAQMFNPSTDARLPKAKAQPVKIRR